MMFNINEKHHLVQHQCENKDYSMIKWHNWHEMYFLKTCGHKMIRYILSNTFCLLVAIVSERIPSGGFWGMYRLGSTAQATASPRNPVGAPRAVAGPARLALKPAQTWKACRVSGRSRLPWRPDRSFPSSSYTDGRGRGDSLDMVRLAYTMNFYVQQNIFSTMAGDTITRHVSASRPKVDRLAENAIG